MKSMTALLVTVSLVILLTGSLAVPARTMAQPLPPPQWSPVPHVPGTEYAPNIAQDLFRYGGQFYNWQNGGWYRGRTFTGPWESVPQPPQAFYNIQAPYFKVPPGWAKGKKKGWGGAPLPPGQMKKRWQYQ
jgi:hypothetical protein